MVETREGQPGPHSCPEHDTRAHGMWRDLAVNTTQQRYQIGASTLLEVTQARASQVQAASAVVSARYMLALQQALMSYFTGDLVAGALTLAS